jgi:hypothetical protein
MKVTEHLAEVRRLKKPLDEALVRFAKEHHEDCECWFELEWGMLLLAFDPKEQAEALAKLQAKYKEMNNGH